MNDSNNKCKVVVSSCDEYKDVWDPCFKILGEEWPDRKYPVVLLTEIEYYNCEFMDVEVCRTGKVMVWGKRMLTCLKSIEEEYIILLLDDFYPLKKVDQIRIEKCLEWMEENKNIAVFCLNNVPGENIRDGKYKGFEKRPRKSDYKFNCQPAIWRKDRLMEFIKPNETPWDFEIIGSIRSAKYDDDFYCAIENEPYIFTHMFAKYGLRQGKWGKATKELFSKYNIEMDFSVRGFYDSEENENVLIVEPTFIQRVIRHIKWRRRELRIKMAKLRVKRYE